MGIEQNIQALPCYSTGMLELIGKDENVQAQNYSKSVSFSFSSERASGEILSLILVSYKTGTGAILKPQGDLYIFSNDPNISANATSLSPSGADHKKIMNVVPIVTGDWLSDTTGAVATVLTATAFEKTSALYFSFKIASGETAYNANAGDDQFLEVKAIFRRDT